MPDDFVIARNPDGDSTLPYLLRVPLGPQGVILKARETWPRTAKVYCHRVPEWPEDAEIVERVPVRSCVRRGAAIDLVLDRGRENRSQLVYARVRGGRQVIFWQTARTSKQARPSVAVPSARAFGAAELEIVVDSRERYAWSFRDQQATVTRGSLAAGDYGVLVDGRLVGSVERKSLQDLASSLTNGKLRYQLADLAALPHAAVVVEERYSAIFGLEHVRPAVVADALAECQVRWPSVPIVFTDTRRLAQEWAYRFLAAARLEAGHDAAASLLTDALAPGPDMASARRRGSGGVRRPAVTGRRRRRCGRGRRRPGTPSPTAAGCGATSWRRTWRPTNRGQARLTGRLSTGCDRIGGGAGADAVRWRHAEVTRTQAREAAAEAGSRRSSRLPRPGGVRAVPAGAARGRRGRGAG